ncbi:MAG: response regulator [Deltaproteobacteria bacterium]
MNPNHLNVYLVDDDEPIRRSVGTLLLAHLNDCSIKTFASGEAFLLGASLDASGVVVLDYEMGNGMTGLEVFQVLRERESPLQVVFLSGKGTLSDAVRAMEKGAVSWVEKLDTEEKLLQTIRLAKQRAAEVAVKRRDHHHAVQNWVKLTLREKQVAALVAPGHSAKGCAKMLTEPHPERSIHPRTVENFRAKAFAKLGVSNSNELLIFLRDNDLWEEAQASLKLSPAKARD